MPRVKPSKKAPKADHHSVGYTLGVILVGVSVVGLALAYAIDGWGQGEPNGSASGKTGPSIEKSISAHRLNVPQAWFRFSDQMQEGFTEKLDLLIPLALADNAAPVPVEVTLVPRSRVRASAQLLDSVYLHLFQPGQIDGPVGLIGKPLADTEGFQGETVWYDPISAVPFVAKCMTPIEPEQTGTCLRTVALDAYLAAILTFDKAQLENWRLFDKALIAPLEQIGFKPAN